LVAKGQRIDRLWILVDTRQMENIDWIRKTMVDNFDSCRLDDQRTFEIRRSLPTEWGRFFLTD
jgi:hypothetical protein